MLKDSPIVIKIAKNLGLKRFPNAEMAIRNFCLKRVERITDAFEEIKDLNQLLEVVSSHLGMKFEEVHADDDLDRIARKYLEKKELFFARLRKELDDKTDGILVRLKNAKPWERKFVAIINCQGNKSWRAYFTKWHEIAHMLTDPPTQMTFQFRRTPAFIKDDEEQIVDRVAGDLAFYNEIFYPALAKEIARDGRLTFSAIEKLKKTICAGASREATLRGAIRQVRVPQLLVIAGLGYKKDEEKLLNSAQLDLFPNQKLKIVPKLRALDVSGTPVAQNIGFRIHRNMEVPARSVISKVYENDGILREVAISNEDLSWWKHSRGGLEKAKIFIEAWKSKDKVFALVAKV